MIVVLHQMSNFSAITWREQVTFDEMMSALYRNNRFIRNNRFHWIFIVLALYNNNLQVEISPHSYTLLWILTNQSFFLVHLNVAFLSRKAINTNLKVFGLTSHWHLNPQSAALEASMLTITPQARFFFIMK